MLNEHNCLLGNKPAQLDLSKWQQTVDLISEIYNSACGTIVQMREDDFSVVVASKNEDNFLKEGDNWPRSIQSFCRTIIETKQELYVHDASDNVDWVNAPAVKHGHVQSYCGLPIYWPSGKIFGTICVIDTKPTEYNATLQALLTQFCRLITSDLKMISDFNKIKDLAITDELTGVSNRRGLKALGEQKFKDARRYQHAIGVVYLDIDNLKYVNDNFGHHAGDRCIITLAKVLQENCRESDIVARLGGDEFIIISLIGSRRELMLMASRMEDKYKEAANANVQLNNTSISFGASIVDCYSPLSFETLLSEADQNMYRHKQMKKAKPQTNS